MDRPAPRLLIVEDDLLARQLLQDLCLSAGYRVTTASDGEEGLKEARGGDYDLLLLDLMLPGMDGFSVLSRLRETPRTATLPIIILTAMGDLDGKLRGMELGADDWLTKPFRLSELQARIHSALRVRASRERLRAAEEELALLRATDPLTGVGTWSQLKVSLDGELARARRHTRSLAVLLLSLEGYGEAHYRHPARLAAFLKTWTGRTQEQLREADRLFRIEPDAFVALLPESDLAGAHRAANRLHAVSEALREDGEGALGVRVLIAGASFPHPHVQTSGDLLREAARVDARMRTEAPDAWVFPLTFA